MRYQDEFRDRELVQNLAATIRQLAARHPAPLTFMEVCGTHTMAIYQHGLRSLLPENVHLVSGPGCPVCVTPNAYLDHALALARLPDVTIASFGDMLRVPGSASCLLEERAKGADVRVVYSPLDAVRLAAELPNRRLVFLGVGFETTAPTVAGSIIAATRQGLGNYFVLGAHKTIPGAMALLADDPELALDGYLCPAHVSAVIGADAYRPLAERHGVACAVTGFEPADVLQGVALLLRQVLTGQRTVDNQYRRVVRPEGNRRAQELLAEVFVPDDAEWRGLGVLPASGLAINERYAACDAARALPVTLPPSREHAGCRCGDILRGKLAPFACPLFATTCTPESPVGACMVSSEGTCAAAYKYGR